MGFTIMESFMDAVKVPVPTPARGTVKVLRRRVSPPDGDKAPV